MQPEQWTLYKNAVSSSEGAVAAQHVQAAACGVDVLASGGNAVDAAVATALMLGVVEPWMCGIGGSGYMVVWDAASKSSTVFDFQGVLPQRITRADYPLDPDTPANIMGFPGVVENRNSVGYRAVAVPGAVKGFAAALQRFGSRGLDTLIRPAIDAAEQGVEVNWFTTMQIALAAGNLLRDAAAREQFLPHGVPLQPGQLLRMPALAGTMKTLASEGSDALYGGALGNQLVADLTAGGSRIDVDDLANYQVIESPALPSVHRATTVHTAGPTSGGPRLIETLQFIEKNLDTGSASVDGPASWSVYADALKQAWRSHNQRIGRTTEVGSCTSHLSTVDRHGNMVALTFTLLDRFGAGVLLPQTGLLMNNAVSYFDPRAGYPTSMEGGKRINASNMCPVVATRDDQSVFAVGASGANYIVPCTAMITALMLDFGLTLEQAINSARIDVDGDGNVAADPRLGPDVIGALQARANVSIEPPQVFPKRYACPSGVSRDPVSGLLHAVGDPSQPFGGGAGV